MKDVAALRTAGEVARVKKSLFVLVAIVAAMTDGRAAQEKFSRSIPPDDFAAAGLGKLSPEEIGRLDRLVRDFKSGALERARREAAAAEARAAQAEAKAVAAAGSAAKDKRGDRGGGSFLSKAKVLLTPGTEIEYAAVESRIVGEFRGWQGRTIFVLENGQRWQAAGNDTYVAPRPISNPAVKITPGENGPQRRGGSVAALPRLIDLAEHHLRHVVPPAIELAVIDGCAPDGLRGRAGQFAIYRLGRLRR